VGATGTLAANRVAARADLVIGVGTRWTDFTTVSKSAFQNPEVRYINVNVADFDAHKHAGLSLVGDARVTLEVLNEGLIEYEVEPKYREQAARS
jgi:3D-(3,5/4)-trihydroxycyclohexane-1,2-dione acylhydrolase (decyclizing)